MTGDVADGRKRIVVAGVTGRVGRSLLGLLASDPVDLVALTRSPNQAVLPGSIRIATAEFGDALSLQAVMAGADSLFLAHGTSPSQVANEIVLIDAAVAADIRHVVKLSALGPATRSNPYAWHMEIEAHLARQPLASTILRPSAFVDALKRAGAPVAADDWGGAAGDGRVNFIDTRDVAAVARVALLGEVRAGSNRALHLTGSAAWTMQEIALELSRILGRTVIYRTRTAEEQRAVLIANGVSPFVADLLVGLDVIIADAAQGETTLTVQDLTGKPPRTVPDWLAENAGVFRG